MFNCKYGSCVSKTLNHKPSANLTLVTAFLTLGIMISIFLIPGQSCAASASTDLEGYSSSNQSGQGWDTPAGGIARLESVAKFDVLQKAVRAGNASAQFLMGQAYFDGAGVPQDYQMALDLWKQSAESGHPIAQCNLGIIYRDGELVPRDLEEAIRWTLKSANNGFPPAEFNMGVAYRTGEGVSQDESQAFQWFHRAAQKGDSEAQFVVGLAFAHGLGVEKDFGVSGYWVLRAAAQGHQASLQMLTITQTMMSLPNQKFLSPRAVSCLNNILLIP